MTAKWAVPAPAFGPLNGQIGLGNLDTNFNGLATTLNGLNLYSNYFVDGGVANAISITLTGVTASLQAGLLLQIKVAATNAAGGVTITGTGLATTPLVNQDGSTLLPGALITGQVIEVLYDGTNFYLMNPYPNIIQVPFNAANFTGNGAMTWTSINQITYYYFVNGKMVTVLFDIAGTVGGSLNTNLRIALPTGIAGGSGIGNTIAICLTTNNGVVSIGQCSITAAATFLSFNTPPLFGTNWSAGTGVVSGQFTFLAA